MAEVIVSKKFVENFLAPLRHPRDCVPQREDEPDLKNIIRRRGGYLLVEEAVVLPQSRHRDLAGNKSQIRAGGDSVISHRACDYLKNRLDRVVGPTPANRLGSRAASPASGRGRAAPANDLAAAPSS